MPSSYQVVLWKQESFLVPILEASCLGATRADVTPELTNAEDSDKFVISLEAASDDPYQRVHRSRVMTA
jgi:hypothetical protein